MANFEDFLNDYDLDEPQEEESLDLPELDSSAPNSYEADFEPEYSDDADDYSSQDAYYQDVDDGFGDDYTDDDFDDRPTKKSAAKAKVNLPKNENDYSSKNDFHQKQYSKQELDALFDNLDEVLGNDKK